MKTQNNTLRGLENDFLNGKKDKPSYISQMYQIHDRLFEYSDFIKDRDIQRIEITENYVLITTKGLTNSIPGHGTTWISNRYDERMAPVEILNFKYYEKEETDMMLKLIKDNDTIFDIGSNIGWYSINFCKNRNNLNIHAFEPIPKTYENLVANAKINGVNITCNNIGLSNTKGSVSFYFYKEGSGNASAKIMHDEKENIEIICQVDTLDSYVNTHNITKIDFIKCDVEGAEILTLQGGLETLKSFKPILFVEMLRKWALKYDYHPNDIIALLKNIGYSCFFIDNGKLQQIQQVTEDTIPTNYFFLHTDKHREIIKNMC